MEVTELPLWMDCPLAGKLFPQVTARCGEGIAVLLYEHDDTVLHVGMPLEAVNEENLEIALGALGRAIFEKEFPGQYIPLMERQAEAVIAQRELSDVDKQMLARRDELTVQHTLH